MTAAALKFDSQAAGNDTAPGPSSASEFRTHLMPHQVTWAVRRNMQRALTYEQTMWSLLVVSTCVMFGGVVGLSSWSAGFPGRCSGRRCVRPSWRR